MGFLQGSFVKCLEIRTVVSSISVQKGVTSCIWLYSISLPEAFYFEVGFGACGLVWTIQTQSFCQKWLLKQPYVMEYLKSKHFKMKCM